MMKKITAVLLAALALPTLASAQGVVVKSGADSNLANVDANKNVRTSPGASTRPTFMATFSGGVTTAAYNMQIDAPAATGIKVLEICITYSNGATAAGTIVTTTVRRTTATGSGGTSLTNNGTGVAAITDLSGAAVAYGGVGRAGASTLGTAGATIDQWAFRQSVLPATTAVEAVDGTKCVQYGSAQGGGMAIVVPAGASNGVSVLVSAGGAGSVATGTIRMTFIAE